MAKPLSIEPLRLQPVIGDWYRGKGELFEVVAVDEDDGSIEIQHFDGTVEELDIDDWRAQCNDGSLHASEAPEDYGGAYEIEDDEPLPRADDYDSASGGLRASGLDGLDLFE
jgi:hypothetical protein